MTDYILTAAIADALADRLNYDALAQRIAAHLRDHAIPPSDPDTPIEIAHIMREIGATTRRGQPITHPTFNRNYIQTGLLKYIPGPNRAKRYVRLGDWQRIKQEIQTKIKKQ